MRIAFLASRYPWPVRSGDQLRAVKMLEHLSARHEVTLYAPSAPAVQSGSIKIETAPLNVPRLAWNVVHELFSSLPVQSRLYHVPELVARLRKSLLAREHDVVVAQLVRTSEWIPEESPVPVILDMVDLFSYTYSRAPQSASFPWRMVMSIEQPRLKRYERETVHRFKAVLLASASECEYLRQSTWAKNIAQVPNGVDMQEAPQLPPIPGRILFFGKLDYYPNRDAALHFAKDMLPAVQEKIAAARFVIAGWDPPREIRELAEKNIGVEILPDLADLRPEIGRAVVTVAPMRSGGGMQNKILESLACGTPVVTYPYSADAFGNDLPRGILVGNGKAGFIQEVLGVLMDPEKRKNLSEAGRESVRLHHSWTQAFSALNEALKSV